MAEEDGDLWFTPREREMPLKDRVLRYVRETDHVSFAELGNRFSGEIHVPRDQPGYEIRLPGTQNVIIWSGLTDAAEAAIVDLWQGGLVAFVPARPLVYMIDGLMVKLPVLKRLPKSRDTKTPHWLPVVLRPAERAPKWVVKQAPQDGAAAGAPA